MSELSPKLRQDAELVVDVCMSVEENDVVTVITDDAHRQEAEALAQVARCASSVASDKAGPTSGTTTTHGGDGTSADATSRNRWAPRAPRVLRDSKPVVARRRALPAVERSDLAST